MDPRAFQEFAEAAVKGRPPVDCRNAISRAYHAAYNIAAGYVRESGVRVSQGERAQGEVWKYLSNCTVERVCMVASELNDFKGQRNRADYDLTDPRPERHRTADALVMQARRNIATLDEAFRDGPTKASITAALKKYELILY